jgi:TRAP-type C4-dicarboxylate transport system substrate-binding protein
VHPNASLFKAPEIKRAVQSGQAQIGEILISGYSNEDPLFGLDSVPFLATSYATPRSSGRSPASRSRSASPSRG